jgi:hypothetical protein
VSKVALVAEESTTRLPPSARSQRVADKEGGLSKDEATRFDALLAEAETFDAEATENRTRAERLQKNGEALAGYSRPRPRQAADPQGEPIVAREAWREDPQCGFKTPKEYLLKVIEAPKARRLDERLQFLAAAGSDEQGEYSDPTATPRARRLLAHAHDDPDRGRPHRWAHHGAADDLTDG